MQRTIRLFDQDSHLFRFTAEVLSCEPQGDGYAVILDQTAFFPEGGGQGADPGWLGGIPVTDVQVTPEGVIRHLLPAPLPAGDTAVGQLDAVIRSERMQCHTAEHMISGVIHRRYGYNNVGFHLGDEDVTLDFDGVLSRSELDEIEDEVNRQVSACLPVRAYYPTSDELARMTYRAKLALTENVRIVEIGTEDDLADVCACCAPHVANTGEVGVIKMLDFLHYKGGIRIHMLAGARALRDYRKRYATVAEIAAALSVKQEDAAEAFRRTQANSEELRREIGALRRQVQDLKAASLPETSGNLCLFENELDAQGLRRLLSRAVVKCGGLCGVFSGSDENGYSYVIGRRDPALDLRKLANTIRTGLNARGGGSAEMLQGRAQATKREIEAFFDSLSANEL